jgi:hypothetical protein
LESPGALRQRIERLLDFRPPKRVGLSFVSLVCVVSFGAIAVPMGPAQGDKPPAAEPAALPEGEPMQADELTSTNDATVAASKLVQDAKLLYEMGKLDEAKAKATEALKVSPGSPNAQYYLRLIRGSEEYQARAAAMDGAATNAPGVDDKKLYTEVLRWTLQASLRTSATE